jgi:phosphosulfolactate synthase
MVIDKGLGLTETRDLLELAADYIDFIKLTFGTSAFYSAGLLRQKIDLVRSYGVNIFPGGTFLEVAMTQGKLNQYISRARELGFTYIEVSDGTITMSESDRESAIKGVLDAGLPVLSEVGKKDSEDSLPLDRIVEQIRLDLAWGASKVIVEGRESGKGVVIYDKDGAVRDDDLEYLASEAGDSSHILWEAPLKNQQQALIQRFGPNVNLGNVAPGDILALEALRVGLRGDTLRTSLLRDRQAAMAMGEGI